MLAPLFWLRLVIEDIDMHPRQRPLDYFDESKTRQIIFSMRMYDDMMDMMHVEIIEVSAHSYIESALHHIDSY